jgi:hypothetical protein
VSCPAIQRHTTILINENRIRPERSARIACTNGELRSLLLGAEIMNVLAHGQHEITRRQLKIKKAISWKFGWRYPKPG